MSKVRTKFAVRIQSHHLVCNATDRSRGFSLGGEVPALVLTVRKSTPANEAGLRCGDFILQLVEKDVHMMNSSYIEKELADMSKSGFDMTVAHIKPWPRNLTEKKYALYEVKTKWEKKCGTGWGPFQVTRYTEDDELVKQQLPAPDISPWTERHGTHADFRKNMHFEEPPSSDSEEDEEKAIKDWKKLFEEDHASASITAPGPPPDRH